MNKRPMEGYNTLMPAKQNLESVLNNRWRETILKSAAITVILLCVGGSVWAQSHVEIRVDHANVRKTPQPSSTIIAVLQEGEVRPVKDDVPYWYQIELQDGRKGWVAKSLCKLFQQSEDEDATEDNA